MTLSQAKLVIILDRKPDGEKTRKELSVLDVGWKPQSYIAEENHAKVWLKTQST